MNSSQLQKTLRLIRRTGDKAVVIDPGSDEVFLLMNLDDYEELLTIREFSSPESDFMENEDDESLENDATFPDEDLSPPDGVRPLSEQATPEDVTSELDFSEHWPKNDQPSALESEESLTDVPDEGEEEKFYLEPVE